MSPLARSRATAALLRPTLRYNTPIRAFATTKPVCGGGSNYDQPTGWLFGVRPGDKQESEGWEKIWYWGYFGSFALATIAYCYKPDTSIQTWALEEARRRLEKEGILPDPDDVKK